MKIKTFTASGSLEAMSLAREALGDNAVIISTETLDDGQIRVTAAIEETQEISFNEQQELEVRDNPSRYTDRLLRESLEYHDTLDLVCERILCFIDGLEGIGKEKIAAVNINIPGRVNSRTGTSATTFNFEDTAGVPLTEYIEEKIGLKENLSPTRANGLVSMIRMIREIAVKNIG